MTCGDDGEPGALHSLSVGGWTDFQPYLGLSRRQIHCAQGPPKARSVFVSMSRHISSTDLPAIAAIKRTLYGIMNDALGCPRCGDGVRKGASVSTRIRSGGATRSASRRLSAFLNVTVPANDRYAPRSTHSRAKSASPEKQCMIV